MNLLKANLASFALLALGALQAQAIQVTSVTTQAGQVEGQSVEISAAVNWEGPVLQIINSFTGPFFSVRARVGSQNVVLAFDSASGRYKGQLQNLAFNRHAATVTATRTTRTATIPVKTTTVSATRQTSFLVGPQAGCFNFNVANSLQGWSTAGMFNGDQSAQVVAANLIPTWNDGFGFLSLANSDNDGGLLLMLNGALFQPASAFPSGFSRFDFRSPDLSANTDWQGIRGVSFRVSSNSILVTQVQPLLRIRKSSGAETFFRPVDSTGAPIFFTLLGSDGVGFEVFAADIPLPAGSTVLGMHLRVFHATGSPTPSAVVVDGVCPRR